MYQITTQTSSLIHKFSTLSAATLIKRLYSSTALLWEHMPTAHNCATCDITTLSMALLRNTEPWATTILGNLNRRRGISQVYEWMSEVKIKLTFLTLSSALPSTGRCICSQIVSKLSWVWTNWIYRVCHLLTKSVKIKLSMNLLKVLWIYREGRSHVSREVQNRIGSAHEELT